MGGLREEVEQALYLGINKFDYFYSRMGHAGLERERPLITSKIKKELADISINGYDLDSFVDMLIDTAFSFLDEKFRQGRATYGLGGCELEIIKRFEQAIQTSHKST